MQRYGAVIIFKEGVTKEQAEKWLRERSDRDTGIIEDPRRPAQSYNNGKTIIPEFSGVEEFDDDCGGPVWYIP